MTGSDTDNRSASVDRGLRFLILVGVAVGFGLIGIVAVGISGRIVGFSGATVMQLLLIGVLFWPVYRLRPWRPGVADRVCAWFRSNRAPVAVAAIMIVASWLPFTPRVLATVVHFPAMQTSGFFFGAETFWRPHVGFEAGVFIRRFGEWYVTVFFVLLISVIGIDIGKKLRSMLGADR